MKFKQLIGVFLIFTVGSVVAGDKGGNGGLVIKCADSIELVDFWEAKVLHQNDHGFSLMDSRETVDDQVKAAFKKLTSFRASEVAGLKLDDLFAEYKKITSIARPLRGDEVYWQFSDDAGIIKKIPNGCVIDNVVHYLRDNYVDMRTDFYERLSETEKAALWVHEVLYKLTRKNRENSSHIARRLTAFLFSNLSDEEVASGLILGFLSDKKVIFINRDEPRENLGLKINYMRKMADNHADNYRVYSLWNYVKVCEEIPRRFFKPRKNCRIIEETKDDFDILTVSINFFGISGTWVRYSSSISLVLNTEILLSETNDIYGTTGVENLSSGYFADTNMLYYRMNFYVVSEKKTFDYVFGRF